MIKPMIPRLLPIHEVHENSKRRKGNAENCE